jgi:hypothetical protein
MIVKRAAQAAWLKDRSREVKLYWVVFGEANAGVGDDLKDLG